MRYLIATDGSDVARHAIAEAARQLPLKDAEVTVVAVLDLAPLATAYEPSTLGIDILLEEGQTAVKANLDGAIAQLEALGVEARAVALQGDPGNEILRQADALRPDAIVVGSHGRGMLERVFLGSVSEKIIRRASWPVFVVHPPAPKA